MSSFLQTLFWGLIRYVLRLRYRVQLIGAEQLRTVTGPTLVMPNHPAYIDPPLLLSHVRPGRPLRPIVYGGIFRRPLLYPFMRLIDAFEVPDLGRHSHGAREQTLAMIEAMVSGLQRGESFLIYPSGHVKRRPEEVLGSARAAAEILARCPQAQVILVRTSGLWGSSFSYAQTGNPPHLARCVLRGFAWLLAGLLWFAPRRKVTMTIEVLDRSRLAGLSREQINAFLEAWYNRNGKEPATFVPYHHLLGPRQFTFPDLASNQALALDGVKPATIKAIDGLLEEHLGRRLDEDERQLTTSLDSLGLDSLERMDLALQIEDRFGFRSDHVAGTVGELWALAEGRLSGSDEAAATSPPAWSQPRRHRGPVALLAETVGEAFVRRSLAQPGDVAVADRVSGVLTYRRLLVGAKLLSQQLGQLSVREAGPEPRGPVSPGRDASLGEARPREAVGVMLPASVAADVVYFALLLAGKLPVMLNWTTGPGNLAHAVQSMNIRHVVTSRRLIDRLGISVDGAELVFLEELRGRIGKFRALGTLLASYLGTRHWLRRLPPADPDAPAVVLFTSGSESAPKAVPLSHRNVLHNVHAAIDVLGLTRDDALLGFLPPFHSFGLTGGMLMPILLGVRVVHHPDPTDARGLVELTARYRATHLMTTPTFLSYLLGRATPDDLQSLRVVVTGAEKCPEAVFARCVEVAPQVTILEGYGITECAPVVAGNRLGRSKPGTVGRPLDGVEVCVVDPETNAPLPVHTTGMLLVHGPTVFAGYWNHDGPQPFTERDGKRWYVTGDLVALDDEGFIHFRGRLKRFLKVAGEMVSLPALEEPFLRRYPPTDRGPQVAVEGVETPDGRWIVLFSVADIALREANALLVEAGFRGVMRLDEVARLESIPVLGTGKTDYKVLRKLIAQRQASVP